MKKQTKASKDKMPSWWKEHQEFLKKFTDCKEVISVPSNTKRKVQRKTNKSSKSSKANI